MLVLGVVLAFAAVFVLLAADLGVMVWFLKLTHAALGEVGPQEVEIGQVAGGFRFPVSFRAGPRSLRLRRLGAVALLALAAVVTALSPSVPFLALALVIAFMMTVGAHEVTFENGFVTVISLYRKRKVPFAALQELEGVKSPDGFLTLTAGDKKIIIPKPFERMAEMVNAFRTANPSMKIGGF